MATPHLGAREDMTPRRHPAARAWATLGPRPPQPIAVVALVERGKSAVYRLEGAGAAGAAVIAKRCRPEAAAVERIVYEDLLPCLPVRTLHYYGSVVEDDVQWLFLEDAGGERWSHDSPRHRDVLARWLGGLHTAATRLVTESSLPRRGASEYLEHLRSACAVIARNMTLPTLSRDDRAVLDQLLTRCSELLARWEAVQQLSDGWPTTLVHGDLTKRNIHIRQEPGTTAIMVFDWELAGWNVPCADLTKVDLATYHATVRASWPGLDRQSVAQMATVGRIFRYLAAINWAAQSLAEDSVAAPMTDLRLYLSRLSGAMAELVQEPASPGTHEQANREVFDAGA